MRNFFCMRNIILITFMLTCTAHAQSVQQDQCNMTFNALKKYPDYIQVTDGEVLVKELLWKLMPDDQKVGLMNCAKISTDADTVYVYEMDSGKNLGVLKDYMSGNYQIY